MIDLYTWKTPNGHKVSIMLEETQLPYLVHPIDLSKGEQFAPEFLKINPNNKIPAIVDREGPDGKPLTLFESGAILYYLAIKTGKFLSTNPHKQMLTMQWLMFQMGSIGPILGQLHHFRHAAHEPIAYAIERYFNETKRLYGVLNKRLDEAEYLAGEYSIADIATFPWIRLYERQGITLEDYPHVVRWYNAIIARSAVVRGLNVPEN